MCKNSVTIDVIKLFTCLAIFLDCNDSQAQIKPDSTLGKESSQVRSTNSGIDRISGGAIRGSNLFHSFQSFNIDAGQTVYFESLAKIKNIFSRVTGNNPSQIFGKLGVLGNANLFLLNPNGIIFGKDASLDLRGSLFVSTADSIKFPDGRQFSARSVNSQDEPLLSLNTPIGLQLGKNPGKIIIRSNINNIGLSVDRGQQITAIGGNITLDRGVLNAPEGKITLGGLNSAGFIQLNADQSFTFVDRAIGSDIVLQNGSVVNVRGAGRGSIEVFGNSLRLWGESTLKGGIEAGVGRSNGSAGEIKIRANSIFATDNSQIRTDTNGIGNAGNINITTQQLTFTQGAAIVASSFGIGNGGKITITASDRLSFDGDFTGVFSTLGFSNSELDQPVTTAVGNGGKIDVQANSLFFTNGGRLNVSSIAKGDAGTISVLVQDKIIIDGQGIIPIPQLGNSPISSAIQSQILKGGIGNAGKIDVNTGSLSLSNIALILADNNGGKGNGGNITINATKKIFLDHNSFIVSKIETNSLGNAGKIDINAPTISVNNSSYLNADNVGKGKAGNIEINTDSLFLSQASLGGGSSIDGDGGDLTINATKKIFLDNNSQIYTQVRSNSIGDAGNIKIDTGILSLQNKSFILADTFGKGNAGDVNINANDRILLDEQSKILSQVQKNALGTAGDIVISTPILSLSNFSQISNSTRIGSIGEAGSIKINVDRLSLFDGAIIDALTETNANGGNMTITAKTIDLNSGGKIITATDGKGNAGNINLHVRDRLTIKNNYPPANSPFQESVLQSLTKQTGLFANTTPQAIGNGGNMEIVNTGESIVSDDAKISIASLGRGNGGQLFLETNSLTLDRGSILASTVSGIGGNIALKIKDLLFMSDSSNISAQAIGVANGGNLNIDAGFVVAIPDRNNNIIASASEGRGGKIEIATLAIFGLRERKDNLKTSDIDASSEFGFNGAVSITLKELEANRTSIDLSRSTIDASEIVNQNLCKGNRDNSFSITGRSGLSYSPSEELKDESTWEDWRMQTSLTSNDPSSPAISTVIAQPNHDWDLTNLLPIAQGWTTNDRGNIVLTTTASQTDISIPWLTRSNCH